jgi:hypothetical protein
MGIGKHGMSFDESRSIQDRIEWSPSKNAKSKHSAAPGGMKHGKHAMPFKPKGGGGGHHKDDQK